jgi:hypothetical protein
MGTLYIDRMKENTGKRIWRQVIFVTLGLTVNAYDTKSLLKI